MDEPIGTQHPAHRITAPARAVTALEAAVPGLAEHRRSTPAAPDWSMIEAALGTPLPADFRLLAELYPTFAVGDFLHLSLPRPGHELAWLSGVDDELAVVRDRPEEELPTGLRPHPAPGGLLPWASSHSGDVFLWTTAGPGPDSWPVTVASRDLVWRNYHGGAVQFVAEWASGTLEAWALPELGTGVAVFR
ncbi:SMI1/KNR4 family protein [Streptomyces sp. NPDC002588]|uniref:SMI1/KNR4 family protein n=1 Tax=Streptomyces sp. NPDC002588 TaxID=3154419 RepID=UPI00331C9432